MSNVLKKPEVVEETEIAGRTVGEWATELHKRGEDAKTEAFLRGKPFPVEDLADMPPEVLAMVWRWERAGRPTRRSRFEAVVGTREREATRLEAEAAGDESTATVLENAPAITGPGAAQKTARRMTEIAKLRKVATNARARAAALRAEAAELRAAVTRE
jgi:hypothetical protein